LLAFLYSVLRIPSFNLADLVIWGFSDLLRDIGIAMNLQFSRPLHRCFRLI
jgi:hypothetical protein